MGEVSQERNHGGEIMGEASRGEVIEEESWRRNHRGEGIMVEESWGTTHGGAIVEEES